jgi:hypothetical protein
MISVITFGKLLCHSLTTSLKKLGNGQARDVNAPVKFIGTPTDVTIYYSRILEV